MKVAFVLRAGTLHAGLDIGKGLDHEVFIAQGGITPEFRLAPYQNLSKIAAGRSGVGMLAADILHTLRSNVAV